MALPRMFITLGRKFASCSLIKDIPKSKQLTLTRNIYQKRGSTIASTVPKLDASITEAVPSSHHSLKIIFSDHQTCDFKYIWLRDNCKCERCNEPDSKQKMLDTANLDMNIKPKSFNIKEGGFLEVTWPDVKGDHRSVYDPNWLYKYGRSFILEEFNQHHEHHVELPALELWDRVTIWKQVPEISYREVMETESGLHSWLEMLYRYGIAIMRGVPCQKNEIINVANRFAYVKTTIWGQTFDVICEPIQTDPGHLAFSGMYLEHHTDMNYREKSPGIQMLHCLKAQDPGKADHGGKSFFVDGFYIAEWLRETQPSAFHILSSTPVKFAIKSHSMVYSQKTPVICLDQEGEVDEIHYNNRTLAPLQIPAHLVIPFYHAYKMMARKMRDPSSEFSFHLVPGDLVAFNNHRVLHGRTHFDPTKVSRHLQGCYIDRDEVFTRYRALAASK